MNGIECFLASRTENTFCNWWFVLRPQETTCHYPLMSTLLAVCHLKKNRWWSRKKHHQQSAISSLSQANTELTLHKTSFSSSMLTIFSPDSLKPARTRKNELNVQWAQEEGDSCSSQWRLGVWLDPALCKRKISGCLWLWAGLFVLAHVGKTWWRRQRGRDADPCSQSQHASSVAALSSLPKGHVWLQQRYK